MKLGLLDLDHLRRGLRTHPRIAPQVADLDLERMRARELVALATELGLDARALIDTVREQDHEAVEYSRRYPAFEVRLEFDLTIEVLGKRVTRKARSDYTYTPEWEYFDLRKRAVCRLGAVGPMHQRPHHPGQGWHRRRLAVAEDRHPGNLGALGHP